MAIKFGNKVKSASEDTSQKEAAPAETTAKKSSGKMKFLKRGADAQSALAAQQAKMDANNLPWRFRIPPKNIGDDFSLTILDGGLNEDGFLDGAYWAEHTCFIGGRYENFVCIAEQEPCPICESNENASMVLGLTVVDWTPFTFKQGPRAGLTIPCSLKALICKQTTMKVLQKQATKRGGLEGCMFEVSRSSDKSPAVGDMYEFVEKYPISDIQEEINKRCKEAGVDPFKAEPIDFAQFLEPICFDAKQLRQRGFGAGKTLSGVAGQEPGTDLDEEL